MHLRMGETIARNMLSWLKLSINCHCCILLVVYIIISMMHGYVNIKHQIWWWFVELKHLALDNEYRNVVFNVVDCVWNVMAHTQKPDFVFRTSPFKSAAGASVQSTTGSQGVLISGSNAGYTMFRGSVKSTGYTLHSPLSPSLPLPCVTLCHHIATGLYFICIQFND